jgi:hypothetical protein
MPPDLFARSPELTSERHFEGARATLALADSLNAAKDERRFAVGWAITMLFYAAVHAVRGYLRLRHGVVVSSHEDIRQFERSYPELLKMQAPYKELKQQSEAVRYYLNEKFTWDDYEHLRLKAKRLLDHWEAQAAKGPLK